MSDSSAAAIWFCSSSAGNRSAAGQWWDGIRNGICLYLPNVSLTSSAPRPDRLPRPRILERRSTLAPSQTTQVMANYRAGSEVIVTLMSQWRSSHCYYDVTHWFIGVDSQIVIFRNQLLAALANTLSSHSKAQFSHTHSRLVSFVHHRPKCY